ATACLPSPGARVAQRRGAVCEDKGCLGLRPLIGYRRGTTDHQCHTVIHVGGYQSYLWMPLSPDAKHLIGEALAHRLYVVEVKFDFSETLKPRQETLCFRPTDE